MKWSRGKERAKAGWTRPLRAKQPGPSSTKEEAESQLYRTREEGGQSNARKTGKGGTTSSPSLDRGEKS